MKVSDNIDNIDNIVEETNPEETGIDEKSHKQELAVIKWLVSLIILIATILFSSCATTTSNVIHTGHIDYIKPVSFVTSDPAAFSKSDYPDYLSTYARVFMNTLAREQPICNITNTWKPSAYLVQNFPLGRLNKSGEYCIAAYVEFDDDFNINKLNRANVFYSVTSMPYSTIYIPVTSLCAFLKIDGIDKLELVTREHYDSNIAKPIPVNVQQNNMNESQNIGG